MLTARVAIIGGGLSGLYAAYLLEQRGIRDYVLLEARDAPGGRIMSVSPAAGTGEQRSSEQYDLGATWFWPALQPDLQALLTELGLRTFEQQEAGDMLLERSRTHVAARVDRYRSTPAARRVVGGMGALIDALSQRLTANRLMTGCRVRRLRYRDDCVEVDVDGPQGREPAYRVAHVLLAVPPRLALGKIVFEPALPDALARPWQDCETWMASHAKYVAVFDRPFWQEQGLSGEVRSAVGPMTEIHDASALACHGALFGFLGIPATARHQISDEALRMHCRAQLVRLFGDDAASPRAEYLKDWSRDPCTAVAAHQNTGVHQRLRLPSSAGSGVWCDRLSGIASEWSPEFSGYAAGALDAARRGVAALMAGITGRSLLQ
ncbi:FAD-dependent oxidoreductase [Cupriavidus taiwanensis]|uniref:Putative amine oxidase oxidoreductase protein n=1 Tax=Cupriavidus taiwanensis TaxID=164546 RepID=A0A375IN05_9BURK|nr:FAD-dependent oxidoreductase [Cupriavidus taiwanensis]SOZ29781.1 putative amine oxidase oxidoreductase protein [Cupriavidus taiwanensis]SPA34539.1 putative amine oxidase oxidoreductase protein [Cupriavidus taiwanensis]SPK75907.1 putative amine oxidase oxidoreductase protein [Cupriavidus taiwanensis]